MPPQCERTAYALSLALRLSGALLSHLRVNISILLLNLFMLIRLVAGFFYFRTNAIGSLPKSRNQGSPCIAFQRKPNSAGCYQLLCLANDHWWAAHRLNFSASPISMRSSDVGTVLGKALVRGCFAYLDLIVSVLAQVCYSFRICLP